MEMDFEVPDQCAKLQMRQRLMQNPAMRQHGNSECGKVIRQRNESGNVAILPYSGQLPHHTAIPDMLYFTYIFALTNKNVCQNCLATNTFKMIN